LPQRFKVAFSMTLLEIQGESSGLLNEPGISRGWPRSGGPIKPGQHVLAPVLQDVPGCGRSRPCPAAKIQGVRVDFLGGLIERRLGGCAMVASAGRGLTTLPTDYTAPSSRTAIMRGLPRSRSKAPTPNPLGTSRV
jgi:hypothetical protein